MVTVQGVGKHFSIPAPSEARVSALLQDRIISRDGAACVYCGEGSEALHVDHITPRAHFPANTPVAIVNAPENLVTACSTCNQSKGPQDLAGFARMLRARGIGDAVVSAMLRRVRAALRRPL